MASTMAAIISPFPSTSIQSQSATSSSTLSLTSTISSAKLFNRRNPSSTRNLSIRASFIEKETAETHRPDTFLRESDGELNRNGDGGGASSARGKFEKMIRDAQDSVCAAIEAADGGGKFKEDVWSRPGGQGRSQRLVPPGSNFF